MGSLLENQNTLQKNVLHQQQKLDQALCAMQQREASLMQAAEHVGLKSIRDDAWLANIAQDLNTLKAEVDNLKSLTMQWADIEPDTGSVDKVKQLDA